jgi:signal transduction histidine kinase
VESLNQIVGSEELSRQPLPPSTRSETPRRPVSQQHVCQFYETDEFLCEAVARFFVQGLRAGDTALLVATPEHRRLIAQRMVEHGASFDEAVRSGQLTVADAAETLARFMDGDAPDRSRFFTVLPEVLDRIGADRRGKKLRIFGEMVDVLWRDGNPTAALRLEELWNELAESRPFELLCGYSMGNFYRAAHAHSFEEVCALHARAIPTEVFALTADAAAREREIALLQQRARSLEAELDHRRELEAALRQALQDRSRAEVALLEAKDQAENAARVKSEFLALMSHELRTPLNAILGYQDLLEHGVGGELGAEQRAYLSRMRSCSQQLLRLIDQVLSLSRIEATAIELDRKVVDVRAVAHETVSLIEPSAMRRGLTLDVSGTTRELTVLTDAGAVRQILLNLLTNAMKFTEAGGIRVKIASHDAVATVEVIDSGIGIRAEDQDRIFEPFVQVESVLSRRYGGSGLGLAVSRDLARTLGGDLTVQSELGRGSTFTLSLPITTMIEA